MAAECSSLSAAIEKISTSESHGSNHGIKSKLLDARKSPTSEGEMKSPESLDIPDLPERVLPDINMYQNKKSFGTGMMDFALLVTNVNQLKHIFMTFDSSNPYFFITLTLVIISVVLQLAVGICLAVNSRYNVKDCEDICKADKINNWTTALIFLITAVNVVIPVLGVPEF